MGRALRRLRGHDPAELVRRGLEARRRRSSMATRTMPTQRRGELKQTSIAVITRLELTLSTVGDEFSLEAPPLRALSPRRGHSTNAILFDSGIAFGAVLRASLENERKSPTHLT